MIIVDINQIMISNLMVQINGRNAVELNEDLVRHMVLNSLRGHNKKFRKEYGEMVIACDSKNVWRREIFPNYKAGRKATREKSEHDWDAIFSMLHNIKDEIRSFLPYKVIELETAEADDIIASIVFHVAREPKNYEKVLILSGDKDFIQLQQHNFVTQYSPTQKKFLNGVDPTTYIKEHILQGDRSDGVPNFLSSDNTFVDELRQKPLSKKKLETWIDLDPEDYCTEDMMRNYQRNKVLIDLEEIPRELKAEILEQYQLPPKGERSKLLNYFISKRLKNLMNDIGDF